MFKPTSRTVLVGAAVGAWVCCAHPLTAAAQDLTSPDDLWTAEIDQFGQIVGLNPPDQPNANNVPETLVYVATEPDLLSRRVEEWFPLTDGPTIDMEGSHSFTRFESATGAGDCCVIHDSPGCEDPECEALVCTILPTCCLTNSWDEDCVDLALSECSCYPPEGPLRIEIENFMIGGLNGGVLVRIRAINMSAIDPVSVKLFYYCDFDISESNDDDEAAPVLEPGDEILAVEQFDAPPADPAKPLWFGGCPDYTGWEIGVWELNGGLSGLLDQGRTDLANADTTAPGPLDHTCALSSAAALLAPGESLEMNVGIGGPGFDTCGDTAPCPWDCDPPGDGEVGITDFLQMLAEWGGPGSCDFDGGGVSITDFLDLLANWGPCP